MTTRTKQERRARRKATVKSYKAMQDAQPPRTPKRARVEERKDLGIKLWREMQDRVLIMHRAYGAVVYTPVRSRSKY